MPVLYLTEDDVRQVLTMDMALEAVELGLKKVAIDEAVMEVEKNIPHRIREKLGSAFEEKRLE